MNLPVRQPDFRNLAAVLEKKAPQRPTLFEFFLNNRLYAQLAGPDFEPRGFFPSARTMALSYARAGYDYVSLKYNDFSFVSGAAHSDEAHKSYSLNENAYISDRASFDRFVWPDPSDFPATEYAALADVLPKGMKVIPFGPDGVLENVITLVGFDALCYMIYDDEQLVYDIFEKVGQTMLSYYRQAIDYPFVGALISNDDWGFNKQTMLAPNDLRRFVFPWHKKIVSLAHEKGLYAILHSCGYYRDILDDVLVDMGYDARHSYEDNIVPVEEAYEELHPRISVLGGLDLNFVATVSPDAVFTRAAAMVARTQNRGGYALGTGNSVPDFVPDENYFAMLRAALHAE